MTERVLKSGAGWRIGWNPAVAEFQGLVGSDDWALELTAAELQDFCRLVGQLAETMTAMQTELMDEEAIACEVESDLVWLEAAGYPTEYRLSVMLHTGRRGEGAWEAPAVPALVQAARSLQVF